MANYTDKNKKSGDKGYKNERWTDSVKKYLGTGLLGKAAKKIEERKTRNTKKPT